ncbi:MAG: hypothetical protein WC840_07280 [Candidatus Peribacteraceae bacterium]
MDRLSQILPKVLRKRGLHEAAVGSQAVVSAQAWISSTFPAFRHSLSAIRIEHGCIVVEADDSIALTECSQRAEELLRHLWHTVPEAKVERVRVVRTLKR